MMLDKSILHSNVMRLVLYYVYSSCHFGIVEIYAPHELRKNGSIVDLFNFLIFQHGGILSRLLNHTTVNLYCTLHLVVEIMAPLQL